MNDYERRFWIAYHGKPTPPKTQEERDEVASFLRELVRETETATGGEE